MNIEPVLRVLRAGGTAHALIGAHAMAVRGYPRFTVDVDLLTADDRVLDPEVWAVLESEGAVVDPRRGDADNPAALLAVGEAAQVIRDVEAHIEGVRPDVRESWNALLAARERWGHKPIERVPTATIAEVGWGEVAAG